MTSRARLALVAAALPALAASAAGAVTCEELREQIEHKIRAAGVAQLLVSVVDAAASAAGRVVGSCDRGARKIVYMPGRAASAPSGRSGDAILTECRDGRVLRGGSCRP